MLDGQMPLPLVVVASRAKTAIDVAENRGMMMPERLVLMRQISI